MCTEARQIGEGGVAFISPEPLSVGQRVLITLMLPESPFTVVQAQVRSCLSDGETRKHRCGVEFINLDFNYKRRIRNYVASMGVLPPEDH